MLSLNGFEPENPVSIQMPSRMTLGKSLKMLVAAFPLARYHWKGAFARTDETDHGMGDIMLCHLWPWYRILNAGSSGEE